MYPARFEYTVASTLEEVIATLSERGDEAKVLAGGQSLIPLMKLRFATPEVLVDLNGVPGLDYLEERGGELRIGALVRHKTCEKSELLRSRTWDRSRSRRSRLPSSRSSSRGGTLGRARRRSFWKPSIRSAA